MTNKKLFKQFLSIFVCLMLIAATAFSVIGCQKTPSEAPHGQLTSGENTVEHKFVFIVVDADGNQKTFDITTDQKTVGAALLKEGLIEGEEGQFGLYVKTVDGITADYDTDGTYWAFYIGDSYASSGVDSTQITDGETYSLVIEK